MTITSKLPNVGTTIFTVMSQLALDHNAINLGQGFPDFNPDENLLDLVNKAMRDGHNQYPAMPGVPALRETISRKVHNLYGHRYNPDTEVTVTSGATEALMASIQAFVHRDDEVVVIEPFYDLYVPAIELAGGKTIVVSMNPPTETVPKFSVDWDKVRRAITPKTRMLIINFPNNPTGINLQEDDLDALEQIVQETGVILLSDEVYEHIVLDGRKHLSMASRPLLAQHSVVIFSFGKTYNITGWKIGYVCAPAHLTREVRKVHQFTVFTVPSPMQVGLAVYADQPDPYQALPAFYQQKHDLLFNGLKETRFKPMKSEGTFFLLADYSEISDLPQGEFAQWLTKEHGVTVIPVSAFYAQPEQFDQNYKIIRFCFAKKDQTLNEALARLGRV
ncbi:MAG: aminotransferase class I/II-fold pyridoxal phosphate-dependent enzyme [Alcaligenaceae bacterium]|nr:aminotransferase class I/II-fold pyridoxal phosphate-dependent enzyme [Alcaligenaceae bacterium]